MLMEVKMKLIKKLINFEIKAENSDLASGIFTIIVAVLAFCATFSHSSSSLQSVIGPVTVPRLVSGIIMFLGAVLVVRHFARRRRAGVGFTVREKTETATAVPEQEKPLDKMKIFRVITPWCCFLLIAIYIFLMRKIGFTLASVFYLTLQIPLLSVDFSKKSFLKAFVIGIIASVIVYLIFAQGFGLQLPSNDWGF